MIRYDDSAGAKPCQVISPEARERIALRAHVLLGCGLLPEDTEAVLAFIGAKARGILRGEDDLLDLEDIEVLCRAAIDELRAREAARPGFWRRLGTRILAWVGETLGPTLHEMRIVAVEGPREFAGAIADTLEGRRP